jgi:transposase-like protein
MIGEKMKANWGIEGTNLVAENPCIEIAKEKEAASQRVPAAALPNPEVPDKASRRRFTAEYKLRIVNQADACTEAGSLGALLRREGLYASNLNTWRHQRERGILSGLTPKKRGRKESVRDPLVAENEKLRKENERLTNRLRQAEIIIDVQKKVSQILGIPLATPGEGGAD